MSEETTEKLKTISTNPLPFEVAVTSQLALLLSKLEQVESKQEQSDTEARTFRAEVIERLDRIEEQQVKLEAEQVKTDLELRKLTEAVYRIDEWHAHFEDKIDVFISEQLVIKKESFRVQKAIGVQPGLERLAAELGVNG